jgi:putative SOS response-associated peptidase YedK
MCNRFEVDTDRAALALTLEAQLPLLFDWEPTIYPRQTAPGLMLNGDGERELLPMQFGLAPPGSKTRSDPKRTLNNTRIESYDKWPWKTSFRRYRCIVPLTSFRRVIRKPGATGQRECHAWVQAIDFLGDEF